MKWNLRPPAFFAASAMLAAILTGCAFTVVRPAPLVVGSEETGNLHTVYYPAYVLVHHSESDWDAHQIKDNLIGLTEGEVVHWFDLSVDAVTPGPPNLPAENGVEVIRNDYAQLPDCAPVRIVGGLFSALGIEKLTLLTGATKIAAAPADPISYFALTRIIYLTDWVQNTVGEFNTGLGYVTPWEGPFVPHAATAPVNAVLDGAQFGIVTVYIVVFRKLNSGVDHIINGCESAWGGLVYGALWATGSLDAAADTSAEREKDVGRMPGPGTLSKGEPPAKPQ